MNLSTFFSLLRFVQLRLHVFVILSCLGLALLGRMPENSAGWHTLRPVQGLLGVTPVAHGSRVTTGRRKRGSRRVLGNHAHCVSPVVWPYVQRSWRVPLLRSALIGLQWQWSGGPVWLVGLPWATWVWEMLGICWPWLREQAEWRTLRWLGRHLERLVLIWVLSWPLRAGLRMLLLGDLPAMNTPWMLGACVVCGSETPAVSVAADEDGGYTATLSGHFTLHVSGDAPFRKRLLILFLRLLEVPGQTRGSRRTRDGRTPFVRQQDLATAFGIPQPDISRWERYWMAGDWRRLLSLRTADVLTLELQAQIVCVFAQFPWWGVEKAYQHLNEEGVTVSRRQVRQAAEESGWSLLRQALCQRYHLSAENFQPHDKWLVTQLLTQVQTLLEKVEAGNSLTPQKQVEIADLQAFCEEVGVAPASPPLKTLPWMLRIEQVLFGTWELVTDEQVRCIYCASTHVARKSRKPRLKKYYDRDGNVQEVEVFRYYCHNPACEKATFTNLPPGLTPYSPYRVETHLLAVQLYAWSYSTYRRTATALGVASFTTYRWVSALGGELLPVAALFGVVRSSGVVGIDEKFVLAPKNDKPKSKMSRWMYVHLAVDLYTYDLLHIAIYPYNNEASTRTFLLAVRTKGYTPHTVVTDLRQDYGPVIARVFPHATHHECIFHALQNVQTHFKKVYGPDYAKTDPQAVALKQEIYAIFEARTQCTARKRYAAVLAKRDAFTTITPEATTIFEFLECHWPKLVNAIENPTIPRTNNVTELVIRRFDQHYQNFCGFDNLESAHLYLAVFEKLYRFTPFSQDAQARIRGKCPLQLAGYDISDLPMTAICSGLSVDWPTEVNFVPG